MVSIWKSVTCKTSQKKKGPNGWPLEGIVCRVVWKKERISRGQVWPLSLSLSTHKTHKFPSFPLDLSSIIFELGLYYQCLDFLEITSYFLHKHKICDLDLWYRTTTYHQHLTSILSKVVLCTYTSFKSPRQNLRKLLNLIIARKTPFSVPFSVTGQQDDFLIHILVF